MKLSKLAKDYMVKKFWHKPVGFVPRGLFELSEYFRNNPSIHFNFHNEDGYIIAVSENFRHGSIVTQAKTHEELDFKIKDAILTAFDIPSTYKKEAGVRAVNNKSTEYVLA